MKTEALKALKALDAALWRARAAAVRTSDHHIQIGHAIDAFYQLKEALAQPEQEPVAFVKAAELEELKHCNGMSLWAENAAVHTDDSISKQLLPSGHVPVYTAPPQCKPLSGYINGAGINANDSPHIVVEKIERAIKAAHGIKE